ncbi:MAG: tetratricopeptide repeat protein [Nitrospirae bacterium]|nr:tetratricopeptide repeat protein [Nitrospirota bacterium]
MIAAILVMALLFVTGAVFVFWTLLTGKTGPLPVGVEGGEEIAVSDAKRAKAEALRNLKDLEEQYADGRISENEYGELRPVYEGRAVEALAAFEKFGRSARTPEPSPPRDFAGLVPINRMAGFMGIVLAGVLAAGAYGFLGQWRAAAKPEAGHPPAASGELDVAGMVARLESRLAANPNDAGGQLMLARSYIALGRLDDALERYRKVLSVDSRNEEAHLGVATLMLQAGHLDKAAKSLEEALKTNPASGPARWMKGLVFAKQGRFDEAERAWRGLLKEVPPDSREAGMIRESLVELEKARKAGAPAAP